MPSRHPTRARWKEVSFGLKEFQHAYLTGNYPAARLRYGIFERDTKGEQLSGVAVLAVPANEAVLTRMFPDLIPYDETLELSRLVLADRIPGNGETWFLNRVFARPPSRASAA
jgi:hypothetical protein